MSLRSRTLVGEQIAWDMKGPCADCPFRRDAPDHEGVAASIVGYVESIERGEFSHTCHKTDNCADGPKNHVGQIQHCGGALHFLVRAKCDLQLPLLKAAEAGKLDVHAMTRRARRDRRVFGSVRELVTYYLGVAQRILAKGDPLVCTFAPGSPGDEPVYVPLSVARAKGLETIECKVCGEPAVVHDSLWPHHMSENFCGKHSFALEQAVRDLKAVVAGEGAA